MSRVTNKIVNLAASGSGQVVMLICVSLIALMGMIAVVTDFSFMQHQRNMMQTAADSAAMAGAEELNYGDVVAAGKADAATNGYTDGAGSVTVAMNNPPSTGPNASNSAYVEAIVTKPEPTYFLRVLGVSTMTVSARAVAYESHGPNCIYVLDPSASGALSTNGNANVQSGCGLMVDSSSSSGITAVGSVTINAPTIGVVGNYTTSGGAILTPTPKTGVIAATDPLAYVAAPTVGSCAHTRFSLNGTTGSPGSPYQLYPGTYCGGISVTGNSWLHFNPGTYVLAGGGMSINANAVMTGAGITFYNTTGTGGYGAITLNGNSQSNFSAPTSGPLAGILFFQDRSIPTTAAGSTISGNSSSTFDGSVYFPTTQLTFNGNSSANGYSIVVANQLVVSGNSSIGSNYSSLAGGSPIRGTILAE
ncbi:MAG TPA: pilus assembly protein TadG-related protein [Candidatus Binatus sp.]|uniref:pilus assembly protein TadG-related protein n=1 Tax=Candidatus Binatus sp. TaxID=2811406 RepID=UPI002B45AC42|nr:pilus assembly protein TadG-related protein [Candidatus Binatus sp.]HKN14752.1 pilus assembly protein TadG-related protein [Candidatus Binatus sp.]